MKIYYSKYYDDYIFVIGGQPYFFFMSHVYPDSIAMCPIWHGHIKNSRMHKRKEDKEVIFICTVRDEK